jgi:hypothetical protein
LSVATLPHRILPVPADEEAAFRQEAEVAFLSRWLIKGSSGKMIDKVGVGRPRLTDRSADDGVGMGAVREWYRGRRK